MAQGPIFVETKTHFIQFHSFSLCSFNLALYLMSPRSNVGTSGVWRALKTIFPNEKVYDNYGRHYHVESKENRQQMLAAQYFFDCNCAACKEDWPVYRVSVTLAET